MDEAARRQLEEERIVDELARKVVGLAGLLRAMPLDPDDRMWLNLHLRIQELGGMLPREYGMLAHLVDGLNELDAPDES